MKKDNLFKTSLSVPIFESYNKAIFNLLKSEPYENYTDVVLSTLGQELENYFSPQDFKLKYRYKSEKSFNNNIAKDSINENFTSNFNKYITYDIIGMRLVVENVPNDFTISKEFKNNSQIELQNLKKEIYSLQSQQYISSNFVPNDELDKKIKTLNNRISYLNNCINFDKLLLEKNKLQNNIILMKKKYQSNPTLSLQSELKSASTILNNLNNTIGLIVGDYAIKDIFKNSKELNKLGVFLDYTRQKYFDDSTGYNSIHFCLKSSLYPSWVAELQDRSSFIEYISKYGPNIHDKIPGKKRRLLPLPLSTNSTDVHNYISKIKYTIPLYTKYVSNGYVKKYTRKQNVQHYYKNLFLENSHYSKIANDILFDKPTVTYLPSLEEKTKEERSTSNYEK